MRCGRHGASRAGASERNGILTTASRLGRSLRLLATARAPARLARPPAPVSPREHRNGADHLQSVEPLLLRELPEAVPLPLRRAARGGPGGHRGLRGQARPRGARAPLPLRGARASCRRLAARGLALPRRTSRRSSTPARVRIVREGTELGWYRAAASACARELLPAPLPVRRRRDARARAADPLRPRRRRAATRCAASSTALVRAKDGALEIHDFKTGRARAVAGRSSTATASSASTSSACATQLGEDGRGAPRLALRGARPGAHLDAHARAARRAARGDRAARIDRIRTEKEWAPRPSALCDWCEYRRVLPGLRRRAPASRPPPTPSRRGRAPAARCAAGLAFAPWPSASNASPRCATTTPTCSSARRPARRRWSTRPRPSRCERRVDEARRARHEDPLDAPPPRPLEANPELAKRYDAPVYGHASDAKRIPGFTHGLEEGDSVAVGRETARVLFIPAHTRGHIAYVFDGARVLRRHALRRRLRAALRGHAGHDVRRRWPRSSGALPGATRVYCGHEYTASNLRFAAHVEPENEAVKRALARAQRDPRAAPPPTGTTPRPTR